jgi:anti-anti-sigma regulatory factor
MVKIETRTLEDGSVHASIVGKIDEHFDAQQILVAAAGRRRVVLRLDGVRSISSLGVRALETFMSALGEREVLLDDISAAMANQLTMIPNLLGRATVRSAKLPFICSGCGAEGSYSVPYRAGAASSHAPVCGVCKTKMDFDGFTEEYLPR